MIKLPDLPAPPLERFRNLIFAVVTFAILSGIVALLSFRPPATQLTIMPPAATQTPPPTGTPGPMRVYVTGDVANPATLYTLQPGSRVEDAISAAGGPNDDADLSHINQAALLHDGDQIDVPVIKGGAAPAAIPTTNGPIHINTANIDDLRSLPGCSAALAQKIIDYRQKNGSFKSMFDLGHVSGIGKVKQRDWAALLIFD